MKSGSLAHLIWAMDDLATSGIMDADDVVRCQTILRQEKDMMRRRVMRIREARERKEITAGGSTNGKD